MPTRRLQRPSEKQLHRMKSNQVRKRIIEMAKSQTHGKQILASVGLTKDEFFGHLGVIKNTRPEIFERLMNDLVPGHGSRIKRPKHKSKKTAGRKIRKQIIEFVRAKMSNTEISRKMELMERKLLGHLIILKKTYPELVEPIINGMSFKHFLFSKPKRIRLLADILKNKSWKQIATENRLTNSELYKIVKTFIELPRLPNTLMTKFLNLEEIGRDYLKKPVTVVRNANLNSAKEIEDPQSNPYRMAANAETRAIMFNTFGLTGLEKKLLQILIETNEDPKNVSIPGIPKKEVENIYNKLIEKLRKNPKLVP